MKLKWLKLLLLLIPFCGYCQNEKPLTKIGGFLHLNRFTKFGGFSLNYESERAFNNNRAFTHGPRLDYTQSNLIGYENLILGYSFKIYPFYSKSKGPYNGLFVGLFPGYLLKISSQYRYGPGLGSLVGYQFWIKNKFSLSAEAGPIYMQNMNENTIKRNPQDRYYYFFVNTKIGFKL